MLDYYEIGQRIRNARKSQNLSQEELAEKIGISVTHMSHIETGNTKLSLPVLAELASALRVTADSLLFPQNTCMQSTLADAEQFLSACSEQQAKMLVEIMKKVKTEIDKNQ